MFSASRVAPMGGSTLLSRPKVTRGPVGVLGPQDDEGDEEVLSWGALAGPGRAAQHLQAEEQKGDAGAPSDVDDPQLVAELDRALDVDIDFARLADPSFDITRARGVGKGAGAADDSDEDGEVETEFADATVAATSAPAVLSEEAQQKIKLLTERLMQYRKKLKEVTRRYSREHREAQRLREELGKTEELLNKALTNPGGAVGGGMRMLRLGGLPASAQAQEEGQRKRKELMRQLYSGVEVIEEEEQFEQLEEGQSFLRRLLRRAQRWMKAHEPLQAIEARYGSSVAAYFGFFRWIILNYLLLILVCGAFLVFHIYSLVTYSSPSSTARPFRASYAWPSSSWYAFVGLAPRFLLLSSYDPGTEGASSATYNTGERIGYVGLLACGVALLLGSTLHKWVHEDRRRKAVEMFEEQAGENKFAKLALNAWDHSITQQNEVEDLKFAIAEQFVVALHEEDLAKLKGRRSLRTRVVLVLRRFVGLMLYLAVQAMAGTAIVVLTTTSSQLSAQISEQLPYLASLSGSIVPASVSVINALLPNIILAITKFEKWDDGGTHIKFALTRLFLAKLLNVLIQAFSFAQLADPFLLRSETYFGVSFKSWRTSTQKTFSQSLLFSEAGGWSGEPECRADQVASGLFTLIVTEFVMDKLLGVGMPLAKGLLARIRRQPAPRAEFNVSTMMVSLLYFQQLMLVAFPYFPFSTLFCAGFFFLNFKFDKWRLMRFMQKPLKPWSAKDSGSFFIKFYLSSVLVLVASTYFFLANRTFPKDCSQYASDYTSLYGTKEVDFSGLEEITFWYSSASSASVTNYGRQALLASGAISAASTQGEVANATAAYMSLDAPASTTAATKVLYFVCPFACGPFVFSQNGYEPLKAFFKNTAGVKEAYTLVVDNTVALLIISVAVFVAFQFRSNTLAVSQRITVEKEQAMDTMIASLQKKIRKLEKQTRLQKEKHI